MNSDIINKLFSFCDLNSFGPGALLHNPNQEGKNIQLSFLKQILQNNPVKVILETGTESGMFSYFVYTVNPNIKVYTFGIGSQDNRSQKCTDYLNEIFGKYITYIEGDSKNTLTNFNPEQSIDFAWIDGGHDYTTAYTDLVNCARLKIPIVCIDDYNLIEEVCRGVTDFLHNNLEYKIIQISNDDRGICYIQRNTF